MKPMDNALQPSERYMHAFSVMPKVRFETQEQDEQVFLILRAHPITQIPWLLNTLFGLIILIIMNFVLPNFLGINQLLFLNVMVIIFLFSYIWLNFLLYFYNVGIVTNKRILDIDFYSILYREVTETRLSKVEDITSRTAGFFGSLFNFGHVHVQTAGTETNIEFLNVPDPSMAVRIINNLLPR